MWGQGSLGETRSSVVLEGRPVVGTQSWSQERSEELERVKRQSDPVRAGLRLRLIWHLPQGGKEVGVQAKKLWR